MAANLTASDPADFLKDLHCILAQDVAQLSQKFALNAISPLSRILIPVENRAYLCKI